MRVAPQATRLATCVRAPAPSLTSDCDIPPLTGNPWPRPAARYAREAADVIRDISRRGRLPILVGGTGLYYRALTRGFFPGPGRDAALRARLERIADRRGPERLHRWLARIDRSSAGRIQPRDRKRLVRALEVYLLTGRSLTDHFADTASPLPEYEITAVALQIPADETALRVARRVDAQFEQGLLDAEDLDEIRVRILRHNARWPL